MTFPGNCSGGLWLRRSSLHLSNGSLGNPGDAGGKVILDDSFNGNIDGMMASFELAKSYPGKKVVITFYISLFFTVYFVSQERIEEK